MRQAQFLDSLRTKWRNLHSRSKLGSFAGANGVAEELEVGYRLLQMLLTSNSWVHRRVDSLRLDLAGDTRLFVSLNFTLPERFVIGGSAGMVIVPLAMMEKGTLRRLDTNLIGGHHSSILTSSENSRLSLALIVAAADKFLDHDVDVAVLRIKARELVTCTFQDAAQAKESFLGWLDSTIGSAAVDDEQRGLHDLFRLLCIQFAGNFLFCAEVDSCIVNRRSVFKFSLDQDSPDGDRRWTGLTKIRQLMPDVGFAASQHVEVQVPQGLTISRLEFFESEPNFPEATTGIDVPQFPRSVAHLSIRPRHRYSSGHWILEVKPAWQGLYKFTMFSVFIVAILVALGFAVRVWDTSLIREAQSIIPSQSAPILLVGPALFLSWISRQPEHMLAARLLAPLRIMLVSCSLCLVLMAVLAAIPVTWIVWVTTWWAIASIAACTFVAFLMFKFDKPLPRFVRSIFYTQYTKGKS